MAPRPSGSGSRGDGALTLLLRLLRRRPRPPDPQAAMVLADAARDRRDWAAAERHYAEVVRQEPGNAAAWVQLGHSVKEQGDPVRAEAAYRRALAIEPAQADTHVQLGHSLKLQGRRNDAVAAYAAAHRLDPACKDARRELAAFGIRVEFEALRRRIARIEAGPRPAAAGATRLLADVSDLLEYVRFNDRPSGIQRVQMELIDGLSGEGAVTFCAFSQEADGWVEVGPGLLRLVGAVLGVCAAEEPLDGGLLRDFLAAELPARPRAAFRAGDALLAIGSTWWIGRHLHHVRALRDDPGIRYVPVLHDVAPVAVPMHCKDDLKRDFVGWLVGALALADGIVCTSANTHADLQATAAMLGLPCPPVRIVRLDGAWSARPAADAVEDHARLEALGLAAGGYVLFVSTIEARKNHLLAFRAWARLVRERADLPLLVCVGKPGWLAEPALGMLEEDAGLRAHVRLLSGLDDATLDALYRNCRATLYPSHYEGWGLPVTESLCHGKVPVTSRAASLPEVGGPFSVTFAPDDLDDLLDKLCPVLFDPAIREALEARIRAGFRPRPWPVIARELAAVARELARLPARPGGAVPIEPNRFYPLLRNVEVVPWHGMIAPALFTRGTGWLGADGQGSWMRAEAPACLDIRRLVAGGERCRLYVLVRSGERTGVRLTLRAGEGAPPVEARLCAGETRWLAAVPAPENPLAITFRAAPEEGPGDGPVLAVAGFALCDVPDAAEMLLTGNWAGLLQAPAGVVPRTPARLRLRALS